jgi:hypothetical protein
LQIFVAFRGTPVSEDRFWRVWHALFPTRLEPFLRFSWIAALVAALGCVDFIFKLTVKLPPDMLATMQRQESVVRAPWFLVCYNVILLLGFSAIYRTRDKVRFYSMRVVAFGMLLAGLLAQILILFVPWQR